MNDAQRTIVGLVLKANIGYILYPEFGNINLSMAQKPLNQPRTRCTVALARSVLLPNTFPSTA